LVPSPSRARPRLPLLASLPSHELAARLVERGGTPSRASSAAARVRGYVHGPTAELSPRWDADVLRELGIGSWAHEALLELDPRLSLEIAERAPAGDGVERLLLRARDGSLLETVLIPGPARTTVCISSQVGCARACTFCETGALGLTRQLDAGEMVDQVRLARALWGDKYPPLTNVVFMGMGEPFDNLGEVARATHVLTDDRGIKLSPSRVTVSTVGVADKIPAFFESCRAELAVSLNAPDDARRSAIMPVNDRFDMATLRAAIAAHLPRGHKVLFEYVLIAGFNDALGDADLVADYVQGLRARVNVIPVNPGPDPAIRPPSPEAVDAFVGRLAHHGVTTLVRRPRGRDVGGACGQLAGARRLAPGSATVSG
jgi:23S rRNA (adenine2503-C2)-methyltransferase